MKLVDLNILIYAVNRDAAQHIAVRRWWDSAMNGDEPIGLAWSVLLGFLRLATSSRVFIQPLSVPAALDYVDAWIAHPNTRLVQETEDHWRILRRLLDASGTAANLTTDAHLASLAIACGATLVSCDTDFARFVGLRWEKPDGV